MYWQSLLCFCLSVLLSATRTRQHHHYSRSNNMILNIRRPGEEKLLVFGDSYTDTGNTNKSIDLSWRFPYGITYPGVPFGRFSNGHLLTDYVAGFLGVKTPISYEQWKRRREAKQLKYGINFAYASTGVFDTWVSYPNMTAQIDLFQQLINGSVYSFQDSQSSTALVSLAGNDYALFDLTSPSLQEWEEFIKEVVNQLAYNLKRINNLGVKKIAVTALEPFGCLPQHTYPYSFKQCNESLNAMFQPHNILLQQAVDRLNNESTDSRFVILDLYGSFMSVIHSKQDPTLENKLKPCCFGSPTENSCGLVGEDGKRRYTLCRDPESSFFWDIFHPTQHGWLAVFPYLQHPLQQLFSTSHEAREVF